MLVRHVARKGCAEPVFRMAYERRNLSPQPKYRFDTGVPDRLLEQTRISIQELESWTPTREARGH